MGLIIHSLGELPTNAERSYYVYLLDYGWDEPLGETLLKNFDKMAALASANNAVVIRGVEGFHFADEVLSWHHVNGQPSDEILPAILITTRHPRQFREDQHDKYPKDRLVLIPLSRVCKSPTEVVSLIEKIFRDIRDKRCLADFEVAKELLKGKQGALVDALILEPNISGIGINLNYLINFLLEKNR
jgi:hypothetical protein